MSEQQTFPNHLQAVKDCFEKGDFKTAAAYLIPLVEAAPDDLVLRQYLTQAYTAFGYYAEAVESYRIYFQKSPEVVEKYTYFGNLCSMAGNPDEAIECFATADKMTPKNADIKSALAVCYVQKGEFSRAGIFLEAALTIAPNHVRALVIMADIDAAKLTPDQMTVLEAITSDSDEDAGQRIDAAFALGKALVKTKSYDQAFAVYQLGNDLLAGRYASEGFDLDHAEKSLAEITKLFTGDFLANPAFQGRTPLTPVFIIGLPRSGTTLVEQILASHPRVFGGGEVKVLEELFLKLEQMREANPKIPATEIIVQMKENWRGEYFRKLNIPPAERVSHVTDKMPLNFPFIGLAHAIFPGAKFIFLRRQAMDTCLSMYFQPLSKSYPAAVSLENLGAYYQLFEKYLAHWSAVLPGNFLEVSYEDLVADQEGVSKKIVDFAGLKWDDACLEYYKNPRTVQTLSNVQVRRPMTTEYLGRWKHFEAHLDPLKKALGPHFDE